MVAQFRLDGSTKKNQTMRGKYSELKAYYTRCFSLIDCIHFNSENTRECYERHIHPNEGVVVPITHGGIKDNRQLRSYADDKLRLGFIGSTTVHKGLPFLIEALKVVGRYDKWQLDVWGSNVGKDDTLPIYYRGKFAPSAIGMVYSTMDTMVVPSQWHETFSLVTLEALSFGVPVIVSDKVGAQDIVREYDPNFVFHDKTELVKLLKTLIDNHFVLAEYNKKICSMPWKHDIRSHTEEIIKKVYLK